MANTVPVSFTPSGSRSKTEGQKSPIEHLIEHQQAPEQSEIDDNSVMNEGGDAGTKGTGSAG
jgi:hypothetical protein